MNRILLAFLLSASCVFAQSQPRGAAPFDPASPGAIGGTTPAAAAFTTLSANGGSTYPILIGRNDTYTTFGGISLNNTFSDTGMAGFFGGGNTNLYFNAPGEILMRPGGTGVVQCQFTASGLVIGGGAAIAKVMSATATLNFGSILAAASADLTITVTGAAVGDTVVLGLPAAPDASIVYNAFVSAADTVTVRAYNVGAIADDPASATYRAQVNHF